jgi:hypothetical protein
MRVARGGGVPARVARMRLRLRLTLVILLARLS